MKTQETSQHLHPRKDKHRHSWRPAPVTLRCRTRKLRLILALAVALLAASSAEALIIISANEVGGNVVFTLAGNLDTNSLTSVTVITPPATGDFPVPATFDDRILPGGQSGAPPGFYFDMTFGTPSPLTAFYSGRLAHMTGPTRIGVGFASHSSSNPGSFFDFGHYINGDLGYVNFPTSYISLSPLSASMSFAGSFSSFGLTPGTYEWNWFNSSNNVHDSAILQIGASVPEPSATMLMVIGLAALGWLCHKFVAEKRL